MDENKNLMDKQDLMKVAFRTSFTIAAVIAYFSFLFGQRRGDFYYLGLIPAVIFAILGLISRGKMIRYKRLIELRGSWGKDEKKKREFGQIRRLFDYYSKEEKDKFFIDDQTWSDLVMDKIYEKLDRTLSAPGEQILYYILRTPIFNNEELRKREKLLGIFKENKEIRENIQLQLFNLGRQNKGNITELLWGDLPGKSNLKIFFDIMAFAPLIIIALSPFIGPIGIMIALMSFVANMYIHFKFSAGIKEYSLSIAYLGRLVKTAKNIGELKFSELEQYIRILKKNSDTCAKLYSKTSAIGAIEGIDLFADYIRIIFLLEERQYFSAIDRVKMYRNELRELYMNIGELDAFLSIASYREGLKTYSLPDFGDYGRSIEAESIVHPLIDEAVPNSIFINDGGIVLTGSNMSGKSTFLRTLGVNALLAQTINTCLAKTYKASFFKIITSISPSDDLLVGKSYYLGEAEALLRIINGCEQDIPTLCIIDEIFRGTNPIERVSASVEILNYLARNNALSIVATHDLELTEMVDSVYECYYFMEDIDEKGLKFDYRIRKGVSPTRNAIKLLKYLGYPEEIVDKTNARVDNLA